MPLGVKQKYNDKERRTDLDLDKIPSWLKSTERVDDLKPIAEERKEKQK